VGGELVILRPNAVTAWRWSAIGVAATALAAWIAIDAGDSLLAWGFLALCLVLTTYVVAQLVVPGRFEIHLDGAAIDVRLPWQRVRVPWDHVHLARVVTVTGEPVLELHVWETDDITRAPRATGILLPLGADLPALHQTLERQLGRWSDPMPVEGRSQPR
jgi:hypothetical protein